MLDTGFLLNMEEHLPTEIATNHHEHRHKEHVKYVGRGAIHVKGEPFYRWINTKLMQLQASENDTNFMNVYGEPISNRKTCMHTFVRGHEYIILPLNGTPAGIFVPISECPT